ncbi:MAG TPA: hypothetical protein IGS17_11885 [Oscillatoriales cyanobacterium M59_W2019_021]|nr:MAG: hypothetical protein D6728_08405 [Cyanobacteria bacterium J055]HIK33810.1 hypothetical protein [Oscillatoriales cyanobacterium M4454_W2019_049]HIK51604.1 hypothetical protein [Oscillatoriales cyanobacterium M59_W2019_021]
MTSYTISQNSSQLYKNYLIVTRFARAWWWATVIDPSGIELTQGIFCHAEGQSSPREAIERAQRDIDTFDRHQGFYSSGH